MSREGHWIPACIGVGSNLDDPVRQVRAALIGLAALPETRVQFASGLYRNPPMGPPDQPDYVNAVAGILTQLAPRDLLSALQEIESRLGRDRVAQVHWGPRRIDLDILTYACRSIDEEGLRIPHPGISERNFVLFPLLDVAPELPIPGLDSVRRLAANVDGSMLERVAD